MCRSEKFLNVALHHTYDSFHRFPMSAVLVQGNRIISIGVNKRRTHTKQKKRFTQEIHAELDCLIKAKYNLIKGATIYVARRLWKDNGFAMAKPCPICEELLKSYEIEKAIYSVADGYGVLIL